MKGKRIFAALCALLILFVCFGCAGDPSDPSQGGTQTEYRLRVDSAKREYKLGEDFSDQIMVSLLGIEDGAVVSQRILSADEYVVDSSAFDSSLEGDYPIRVTQKGTEVYTTFTVSVRAIAVERLELQGQRLRFVLGEAFDPGSLTVTVHFEDNTSLTLGREDYTIDSSTYNAQEPGAYEIAVTPDDYSVTEHYTVYVREDDMPDYGTQISILAIGNSFSQDAMRYLYQIYQGYGYTEIELANLMMSGCSLAQHCENLRTDAAAYEFEHNTNGTWQTDPEKRSMAYGIDYREWDIIVIQQVSGYAGDPASYGDDFKTLLNYVSGRVAGKSTRIYWHMTWAYQSDSTHVDFAKYDNDQMTMYRAITDTVRSVVLPESDIDGVIPSATAVQNMRTGSLGDTLTRDGFHMNLVYGRYLVGLTWACALTGEDPAQAVAAGGVTPEQLAEIKESVAYAVADPYQVTSIA